MTIQKQRLIAWVAILLLPVFPTLSLFFQTKGWMGLSTFLPESLSSVFEFLMHVSFPVIVILISYFQLSYYGPAKSCSRKLPILMLIISIFYFTCLFVLPHSFVWYRLKALEPAEVSQGQDYRAKAVRGSTGKFVAEDVYYYRGEMIPYQSRHGEVLPFVPSDLDYKTRQDILKLQSLYFLRQHLMPWLIFLHLISIVSVKLHCNHASVTEVSLTHESSRSRGNKTINNY